MRRTVAAAACAAMLVGVTAAEAARVPSGPGTTWPLAAKLLGANEISEAGKRGAGDADARGHASVSGTDTRVCVALAYKGLDTIVAAHIHEGKRNKNGPVVIPLATPADGAIGASSSCHDVAPALAKRLVKKPGNFYVNVHTEAYPNGAIRGQLKRG